jgi:hypothetical protein
VLILGATATLNAFLHRGDMGERPRGHRWDTFFMMALDIQVLLGLVLHLGLSPYMREALNDLEAAVSQPVLRFWVITHVALMFVAFVAVRVGRVLAMGQKSTLLRRNGRYVCFGIAVLAILAGVPWPGLAIERPLFRF